VISKLVYKCEGIGDKGEKLATFVIMNVTNVYIAVYILINSILHAGI
jgi:hypothetical protein